MHCVQIALLTYLLSNCEAQLALISSGVVMLWLAVQQEILVTEKVLLEGLRFDLLVELPYVHLLNFIKLLQGYQIMVFLLSTLCPPKKRTPFYFSNISVKN